MAVVGSCLSTINFLLSSLSRAPFSDCCIQQTPVRACRCRCNSTTPPPRTMPQSIKLEDNVPRVQPTPQSIDYEMAPQSNLLQYVDHAGYKTELGSEVEVLVQQ